MGIMLCRSHDHTLRYLVHFSEEKKAVIPPFSFLCLLTLLDVTFCFVFKSDFESDFNSDFNFESDLKKSLF